MKKLGYLFIIAGICLVIYALISGDYLGLKTPMKFRPYDYTLLDTVTLKHGNEENPTIETFTFPEKLNCNYKNEYRFDCNSVNPYSPQTMKILGYTSIVTDLGTIINGITRPDDSSRTKVDIDSCPENMRCFRFDSSSAEDGKVNYYLTEVNIIISNQRQYFTFISFHIYTDADSYDKDAIKTLVDNFISSIKIENYIESEKVYKDGQLEYILTAPRYNESSEIRFYFDEEKYSYPDTMYFETNDQVHIKIKNNDNDVRITYYYDSTSDSREPFTFIIEGVPVSDDSLEKIMIGNKEVYKVKDNRKYFWHSINNNYSFSIVAKEDLTDEELLDFLNYK